MLRKNPGATIAAAAALLLSATISHAQTIAYDAPVQAGNQNWTGNLGLDFDVNSPIIVTHLGVFDSNGDGIQSSAGITVAIFNRDTHQQNGPECIFNNATNGSFTLVNGDRFCDLSAGQGTAGPFNLLPGHYSVVAVGFSASDLNGNVTCVGNANPTCLPNNPFVAPVENTGGGLITFVGTGRFDMSTSLDYPMNLLGPGTPPSNSFLAGTFKFKSQAVQAPTLTKVFATPNGQINFGETTTLTFTLTNPNAVPLTGLAFSDTLPPDLLIATPNGHFGGCGANAVFTWTAGTNLISLSNGTVGGNEACTFGVNVTSGFGGGGPQRNTTSAVTSNEASPGAPATATLLVYNWWLWFFH